MVVAKISCPECEAVLRPAKPLTPGKKVACPRCGHKFTVPGLEEPEDRKPEKTRKESRVTPEPPRGKESKKKDEDEEENTYGLMDTGEEEEEETTSRKPRINYAPDLSVKDPRGPASARLALPSDILMGGGAFICFAGLIFFCVQIWPFLFSEDGTAVTAKDAVQAWEKQNPDKAPKRKEGEEDIREITLENLKKEATGSTATPEGKAKYELYESMKKEDVNSRILWAILSIVVVVYFAVLASAAVRLRNLDSYRWAMTAGIMGVVLGAGVLVIVLLKDEKIIEAFEYKPE